MNSRLPSRLRVAAVLSLLSTVAVGQTWTMATPTTSPTPRRSGAAAFDPLTNTTLIYGGLTTGPTASTAQTWGFDGLTWNLMAPATTPPTRWGHRMIYDSRRGRIVTFGGRSPTLTADSNDTWEWDGLTWIQRFPTVSPGVRSFYSMAYDERRGRTIIFGAMSTFTGNQTWEYDGTTWAQVVTPTSMVSRETPAMVYDKGRGVTVLFGGYNASSPGTMYADTWQYDGLNWVAVTTLHSPPARYRAACAYDDSRGRVVLYGGFGNGTALTDTWEFDGNDWTQVAATGPTKSTESYMAYDALNRRVVHFGGSSAAGTSAETWTYVGPMTALFAPYGRGCAGSQGLPQLQAATLPVLGSFFTVNIVNLPAAASFTTLALGFDNNTWAGIQLPLDLTPLGLGGCFLETEIYMYLPLPVFNGTSTFSLALPVLPAIAGVSFYMQAYTDDPAGPNGIGSISRAGHGVLGY